MEIQLELGFVGPEQSGPAESAAIELPKFSLSEETTPAQIVAWWDGIVEIFTEKADRTKEVLKPIDAELAGIKGATIRPFQYPGCAFCHARARAALSSPCQYFRFSGRPRQRRTDSLSRLFRHAGFAQCR
jgi:hypothetical protein